MNISLSVDGNNWVNNDYANVSQCETHEATGDFTSCVLLFSLKRDVSTPKKCALLVLMVVILWKYLLVVRDLLFYWLLLTVYQGLFNKDAGTLITGDKKVNWEPVRVPSLSEWGDLIFGTKYFADQL